MESTVNYKGVELILEGEYYEGSPMVMYYDDMSGHPGDSPEFEITKVTYNGTDVTDIFDVVDDWETLEELALDRLE
jgi:hypothetical protein